MNINRTDDKSMINLINLNSVMSSEAIEALKDELVAECSYADMVADKGALKEQLFNEYLKGLKVKIVPDEPVMAECYDDYVPEISDEAKRRISAAKVRSRRRSTYFAKKNLGRKAQIASKSKRTRWNDDRSNHVGHILVMGTEIIKIGNKGSKTERMWRLNKKAKKIGMAGNATA